MGNFSPYLILQKNVERECKRQNEEEKNEEELSKSEEDLGDHDHVDAQGGKTSEEQEKVEPGK